MRHTGRTFLEHLLLTWRILADWKMPVPVCRAGLMHSVYSTSRYPHQLYGFDDRRSVRRMIGREAEALAYRFCAMERRGYWDYVARHRDAATFTYRDRFSDGASSRVARDTIETLLIIDSANVAEQRKARDGGPMPWMSRVLRWWRFLDDGRVPVQLGARARLTVREDELAIEAYRLALSRSAREALPLLELARRSNPWAAEPCIALALCRLELDVDGATDDAARGAELLRAWAVAWDKRLTLDGWKALAERAHRPRRRSSPPRFRDLADILEGRSKKPRWLAI